MIRYARRSRWALLVAAAATLALAGCGRKAGLDLPPGAAAAQAAQPADPDPEPAVDRDSAASKGGGMFDAAAGANAPPTASRGRKKAFPLDPLLD